MSDLCTSSVLPPADLQFIGVDIGGTKCAISQWEGNRVVESTRIATGVFTETYPQIEYAIRKLRDKRPPRIGISCGGPLDSKQGIIINPPNLHHSWHGVPLCKRLTDTFGGIATLMNDANACTLAEWRFGAGLILNGQLYEGATGDAGEIGHLRLAPEGPIGFGKTGSAEGFCSGGGIARLAQMRFYEYPHFDDKEPKKQKTTTAQQLAAKADQCDPFALAIFEEVADRLGEALAILIDLFNPETIILGGFYPKIQHLLAERMNRKLRVEALPAPARTCTIQPAQLGDTIGSHGAIAAAQEGYQ